MGSGKSQEPSVQELLERIKILEYHLGIKENLPVFPLSVELEKLRIIKLEEVTVKFERTHPDAVMPSLAYDGDACFDLMAVEDTVIPPCITVKAKVDLATVQQIVAKGGRLWINSGSGEHEVKFHKDDTVQYLTQEQFLEANPILSDASEVYTETVQIGKAFVPVGLKMELPEGWEATFRTRSGMGVKRDMRVHPGTIDAGYRGDLAVAVYNMSSSPELIKKGTGVAQVAIRPVPKINIVEGVVELNSQRGEKGFGSSDKK